MLLRFLLLAICCAVFGTTVPAQADTDNKTDSQMVDVAHKRRHGRFKEGHHSHAKRKHGHFKKGFGKKVIFVSAASDVAEDEQDGSYEKPFTSLQRAFDAAGQMKPHTRFPVTIIIKSGTYLLDVGKNAFETSCKVSLILKGDVYIDGMIKTKHAAK